MSLERNLADLLDSYMINANIGDARLASQVNQFIGRDSFLHRSTVRNWRTGFSKRVRNWKQLVSVAAVLRLNKSQLEELLESAGLPTLNQLKEDAEAEMDKLLARWLHQTSRVDLEKRVANLDTTKTQLEKCVHDLETTNTQLEERVYELEKQLHNSQTTVEKRMNNLESAFIHVLDQTQRERARHKRVEKQFEAQIQALEARINSAKIKATRSLLGPAKYHPSSTQRTNRVLETRPKHHTPP